MNGFTRRASVLLITTGMALIACAGVAHATPANDEGHKVWVCKYVGQPGDFETLKPGKNPISVDVAAADQVVGADFADGQFHSVVIALNPNNDNEYTGEATCPTSEVTTTTTVPETTTSTISTSSTTAKPSTTTTPSSPGTQTPRTGTTVLIPSSPISSHGSPTLPFTGTSTVPLLVAGLGLLLAGVAFVLRGGKGVRG